MTPQPKIYDVCDFVDAMLDIVIFAVILSWFRMVSINYIAWQDAGDITVGEGLILLMVTAIALLYSMKPLVNGITVIGEILLRAFIETDTGKKVVAYIIKKFPPAKVSSDITTEG